MESKTNPVETLSEVLQWACSPRGGNNFYGRILNGCGRAPSPKAKTACVTITREGKYMFLWDPDWFSQQPMGLRILVVVHEAGHIVLQHLERIFRLHTVIDDDEKFKRLQPLIQTAADMAVNDVVLRPFTDISTFQKYKEALVYPEHEPYKFPHNETFEQYLERLIQKSQKEGYDPLTGKGERPDWLEQMEKFLMPRHIPWWEMASEMTQAEMEHIMERARRETKSIVQKAVEQTVKSRGTVPGALQKIIDDLLEEPTIPWEVLLRGMLKNAISSKLQESLAWPNTALLGPQFKQEGLEPYPGYQKDFEYHIAVAVDTSGSVSDDEFVKFLSEIRGIQKTNKAVSVQMMMFDAAIQHEFLLGENDDISDRRDRHGYGGTDFTPPLKRILGIDEENDWEENAEKITQQVPNADIAIMFTDGYAPVDEGSGGPMPKYKPPCPLMWVLTPGGQDHPAMGERVIHITEM